MSNLTVEVDENIFGEDLFNQEVLGEFSTVFGDDAKAAAEAAMAEAQNKAAADAAMADVRAKPSKKSRRKHCPVIACPVCSANLCVVYASPQLQTSGSSEMPPPAPVVRAVTKSVPKARVVGAVATLASEFFKRANAPATASAPVQLSQAPKALLRTGANFSGTCPNCGTNLDLTVVVTNATQSTVAPMTVKQIVGDDLLGAEDALGEEILSELVGNVPKTPPKPTPPKPTPPVDAQPDWQKYLNLAAGFLPAITEGIAAATKPASATSTTSADSNASKEPPPPQPVNFLMQDMGPLPVWGWGVTALVIGGGLIYWKSRKKPG